MSEPQPSYKSNHITEVDFVQIRAVDVDMVKGVVTVTCEVRLHPDRQLALEELARLARSAQPVRIVALKVLN